LDPRQTQTSKCYRVILENLTLAVDVFSLLSASTLLGLEDNEIIRISQSVYYVGMRVVSYYSENLLTFGGFA